MLSLYQSSDSSSEKSQQISVETNSYFEESYPPSSFKRYFSKQAVPKAEISEPVAPSAVDLPSTAACGLTEQDSNDHLLEDFLAQSVSPQAAAESSESSLAKPVTSASSSTMTQTPAQSTPKRSMLPSSDVKMKIVKSTGSLSKPAKRFLNFSGMEGDISTSSFSLDDFQCYDIHRKKDFHHDGHCQKNRTSGVICQESSCLPELVRVIYDIFKSVNCSNITKEELVHKVIMNSLDVTERSKHGFINNVRG